MTPLPSQRSRFAIPDDVAYLNCAYMSPLPRAVVDLGQSALARKARPWEITPPDFFTGADRARAAFARLLGPPATADDIALVPAASYGVAVAIANLPVQPGQRVIGLDEEFPSTILGLRERARARDASLVLVPRPSDHDWTRAVLAEIDERTALAALPACHWVDGARLDLTRIRRRLSEVGAALVLDLTQSLGVMPFDLAGADPDFAVAAAYKWLLGPYSTGFLYVAPRRHDGVPLEFNWIAREGSEDFSALTAYAERYQPGARRFDIGESANFALLPPATASLEQILAWGVDAIYETAGALADEIVARGEALGLEAVPAPLRARHYVGLRTRKPLPPDLIGELARQRVYLSVRGGRTLRITPHVYNEARDIDRLFSVLEPSLDRAS